MPRVRYSARAFGDLREAIVTALTHSPIDADQDGSRLGTLLAAETLELPPGPRIFPGPGEQLDQAGVESVAAAERHIRHNPARAQYIVADDHAPVVIDGSCGKQQLDARYIAEGEQLLRGWRRLNEVAGLGIPIIEYLLPEVVAQIRARSIGTV